MDEDFSRDRERTRQVTETSQYVRPRRALAPGSLQLKKWLGLGSLFVYPATSNSRHCLATTLQMVLWNF